MSTRPALTVLTQNLYLGADLAPALAAATPAAFVAAVAAAHAGVLSTDFPRRAAAFADLVAAARPAILGLQEVADWQVRVRERRVEGQDFLVILLSALVARGLDYRVAAVSPNALVGPAPLGTDGHLTLRDRDVVLVDATAADLVVTEATSGRYVMQESLTPPLGPPISFARGWAAVDATWSGVPLRFVTTHTELDAFPNTQLAQVHELLTGPAAGPGAVVVTGDLNAVPGTAPYGVLVQACADAWSVNGDDPGATCGRDHALADPTVILASRIDLVLIRGPVRTLSARVVGTEPLVGGAGPPWWVSDHAGVLAALEVDLTAPAGGDRPATNPR